MTQLIGHTYWAISEGYIPDSNNELEPDLTRHEPTSFVNSSDTDAHVEIRIFFTDKEPIGPYEVTVPAGRTLHLDFNDLSDPEPIPRNTHYACIIESDVPIIVQHIRLQSPQPEDYLCRQ